MKTLEDMIKVQLMGRDISDPDVLRAMKEVDRAIFVPGHLQHMAYEDTPLPIGNDQTISQPYIVAYMAQTLGLKPDDKILEIGSGCGYSAAILSRLVNKVYTIEIIEWLAQLAQKNLARAGITNVEVRTGDGYQGWPEEAPFDKIVFTAAVPYVPEPIKEQLKTGGNILAPVANNIQELMLLEKMANDIFDEEKLMFVSFVPLTGQARWE